MATKQSRKSRIRSRPRSSTTTTNTTTTTASPWNSTMMAACLLCWSTGTVSASSEQPHVFGLPQHRVPPFRDSQGIPFSPLQNYAAKESGTRDVFHSIVIGDSTTSSSPLPAWRDWERQYQEKHARLFGSSNEQSSDDDAVSDEEERRAADKERTFLRGILEGTAELFPKSSSVSSHTNHNTNGNDGQHRLLESSGWTSTENDFVVTTETDYANSTNATNNGNDGSDITGEYNPNTNDESSSVVTMFNQTDNSTDSNPIEVPNNNPVDGSGENTGDDDDDSNSNNSDNENIYFEPIRIRAVLSESHGGGEHLDEGQLPLLLEDIVRPALLAWSRALRVPHRLQHNNEQQPEQPSANLTLDPTQWPDQTTCGPGINSGLPTARVPRDHLLYGVPDTDLVIYLNLGFVQQDETIEETVTTPTMPSPAAVPTSFPTSTAPSMNVTVGSVNPSDSPGAAEDLVNTSDVNLLLLNELSEDALVNGTNTTTNSTQDFAPSSMPTPMEESSEPTAAPSASPKPQCAGDYLASSIFCSTNELDRPTAAMLHLCIGPDFFDPQHLSRNILTVMHEIGHSLGFNAESLAHFRRRDGSPITPRDATGAIVPQTIECTGPQMPGGRPTSEVTLPSPEILQFRTVRGGVRVAEVVTPSVKQVVRNHFDCQHLPGAELESGEFLPFSTNPDEVSCLGDHWERRLFKMDIMNPIIDDLGFDSTISTLTLAYFADSGWYQVDLSSASVAATWGRGAGCAFVEEPCIQPNGQIVPGSDSLFCNAQSNINAGGVVTSLDGCTTDMKYKAACTMSQYDGELPPDYQYFSTTHGPNVGGLDPFMDYCPVYNGLLNGLCTDPENVAIRISNTERLGSKNSRCLSAVSSQPFSADNRMALCLRIACVVEDKSLRVQVDGKWHICDYKDQPLVSSNNQETILCPDSVRVCPTFYCPRDCLGTGLTCDYNLGACVCKTTVGDETVVSLPLADGTCPDVGDDVTGGGVIDDPLGDGSGDSGDSGDNGGSTPTPDDSFYLPPEVADADPTIPQYGSVLDDIYYPDERTLVEDEGNRDPDDMYANEWRRSGQRGEWKMAILGAIVLMLPIIYYVKKEKASRATEIVLGDDANDGGGGPILSLSDSQRRNKDKMVATVLVDLRMNDPHHANFQDVLVQRDSLTDRSMTDTDGGSFVPWEDQLSSRDFPSTVESVEENSTGLMPSTEPTVDFDSVPLSDNQEPSPSTMRRRFFHRSQHGGEESSLPSSRPPVLRVTNTTQRRFFRRTRRASSTNNNSVATALSSRRRTNTPRTISMRNAATSNTISL